MNETPLAQELDRRRYRAIAERVRNERNMARDLCECGDQRAAHPDEYGYGCQACEECDSFDATGDTLDEWAVALKDAGYKTEEERRG